MKKSGPKKVTYTEYYCSPCKYLETKLIESSLVKRIKAINPATTYNQYRYYCIHPDSKEKNIKRLLNQINDNLMTPIWCPYLNK